jgi:hypothetical protein
VPDDAVLPSLEPGVTLLDVEGGEHVIVQSLALDHLLVADGPAFWVDAGGRARTTSMARLAPGRRLLDRVHVARGFTAYQHYAALQDLSGAVERHLRRTAAPAGDGQSAEADGTDAPATPALVVAPAIDARYRSEDDPAARTLQARALARLEAYAEGYDAPVLVTRTADDAFSAPVERVADRHLRCERTAMGPRFVGESFETLVYPVAGGAFYQTTFAYWRRVLAARARRAGHRPATSGPVPGGETDTGAGVGRAVVGDGTTASLTAAPLADAWAGGTGASAGGR